MSENDDDGNEDCSPSDKTIELVKSMHEAQFTRKEDLDENAGWLTSTAAMVAALYTGFGAVIATHLFTVKFVLATPTIVLIIGIGIFIASIFIGNKSSELRNFTYPFNVGIFVKKENPDGTLEFDDDKIDKYRNFEPGKFDSLIIKIYTRSTFRNKRINDIKAAYLYKSQYVFYAGLVTIPLYLLLYAIIGSPS